MSNAYHIARDRPASRVLGRVLVRVRTIFVNVAAQLSHIVERRRAATALSHLSDHQLRDIGVSRTEINHALDHGRFFR